ncbi:MAG: hypothetical protein GXO89_07055 [Chlorobi bacterium]|nr:hypothetical protein [Chlorobiota bacterium]
MMKNILALILFFLILNTGIALGQSDPFLRVEIDVKSDEAAFKIIPCNDKGVVFFYETTIKENDYKFWVFVLYNKYMQEAWKKDIPVFHNLTYRKHVYREGFLYILFHDEEKKKSETYNYQLMKLDLADGKYELFSGEVPNNAQISAIEVIGNSIFAGINTNQGHAALYRLDLNTKETKELSSYDFGSARFESFYLDTLNNSVMCLFNVFISKGTQYLLTDQYNAQGELLKSIKIIPEKGKKFNSGKLIAKGNDSWLLIGPYDYISGTTIPAKDYFRHQASGFYTINIHGNEVGKPSFNNFLDLENMTGYLKSREFETAKRKAEKSEKAKEKNSIDFNLLLHDIIKKDSLYYFVSEGYYEEYHTVTNTYYDYYGHPSPVSYSVFDGYKYFNAFVACYDENGNKLWDNGMEIFNILTLDLVNRVVVYFAGDEMVLAFNRQGKIGAKIIKGNEVIAGLDYFPVETSYNNDKIMEDTKSNMVYWYGNYFLTFGFQTIKNNTFNTKNKRKVFYINKIGFH